MTTKEIISVLGTIKKKFSNIDNIFLFWSTANYKRNSLSDIDMLVISNEKNDSKLILRMDLFKEIKTQTWLESDIKIWTSIDELKSQCLNHNIFNNLIEV